MAFSIPIYRISDAHADKQRSTRSVLPLTPSPTTVSSSSYSSGHLEVSHYTEQHDEADHHRRQLLKQSPSSYRCNNKHNNNHRRYGSIMDHQDAAFLDSSEPSTPVDTTRSLNDDSASIRSVSSSGSEASFKTATTTAAAAAAAEFASTHLDMPPTPPHTTVSPNDNDEGLYLLWTHQLLRERGFKPSPCRLKEDGVDVIDKQQDMTGHDENNRHLDNDEDEDDDDSDDSRSTDSSLTDGDNDKESSLLLTTPDIADYGSRMRMYSSFNSCASSFTGSRSQQQPDYFFHHRYSASSSSMHLSAARHAADEDEQDKPLSFFASLFGACFSCRR